MQRQENRLINVRQFLANSEQVKEIDRIYNTMSQPDKESCQDLIKEVKNATTFEHIFNATDKLDFEKQAESDENLKFFGATNMKMLITGLSYLNNKAAFIHQLRILRDKAITIDMENKILEGHQVKELVEQSSCVKQMKQMALRTPYSTATYSEITHNIDKIERAQTFAELLEATEDLNLEKRMQYDPTARYLGVTGIKTLFWLGSMITDGTGFPYQLRLFREETIKRMAEEGYYHVNNNTPRHVYSPPGS